MDKETAISLAKEKYMQGFHCSEMVLYTIGTAFVEDFDPRMQRIATPFGGGIAERGDICGALAGGLMAVGLKYGRVGLDESQATAWRLAGEYYDRFKDAFSATSCLDIHGPIYNKETHAYCAQTLEKALRILWDIMAREG